jgi:hypothetical protein
MPGVNWRSERRRAPDDPRQVCTQHSFDNIAASVWFSFGKGRTTGTYGPKENPILYGVSNTGGKTNELIATPDTASDVLWQLMAPGNSGIGISFAPKVK